MCWYEAQFKIMDRSRIENDLQYWSVRAYEVTATGLLEIDLHIATDSLFLLILQDKV